MTGHKVSVSHYPLASKFHIILTNEPELELPLAIEEEVELIWLKEKATKNLYNSLLFSLTTYTEQRLVGHFVDYRYYIASRHSRKLQDILKIHPLGVSGLCLCNEHLLIGTRDLKLTTYGGYLECVPSGSVEARAYMQGEVDIIAQAMWELQEEARIGEKHVHQVTPLGLYFNPHDGVYDIGLCIRLKEEAFNDDPDGTHEYPLLKWYSQEEWETKLKSSDAKIVPLSKALWKTYCNRSTN